MSRKFSGGGIYLIGCCSFVFEEEKVYYFLKVGRASNFAHRESNYSTHNPKYYKIDKKVMRTTPKKHFELLGSDGSIQEEEKYHKILSTFGECDKTEWYLVSRENFLKVYNGGFRVLDEIGKEM